MMEKIAAVWVWCGVATQAWWYAANAPLWSALILMFIKQRNFSLKWFVSTGLSFTKRHKAECLMRFHALSGKSPISCLSDIEMGQLADSCLKKSKGILLWPLEISAELRLKVTCFLLWSNYSINRCTTFSRCSATDFVLYLNRHELLSGILVL